MLLISCPNCGSRDETEFHYGGQAHVPYPENPNELNDREWAEFLFYRENTKGIFAERWLHSTGCRQWFNMLRDTVTYDIQAVYPMGTPRPAAAVPAAPEAGTASVAADSTTTGTAAPSPSPDALSVGVPIGARKQPQLIEQPASDSTTAPSTAPEGATK
jgi:sarcosine oxidase subunit delta